jgi:glycosyltransferase involved in cell wall biosynthesis
MATVSVFIPCYKYGRYLRACVESVLRQEGVGVRVLILDDCSPDNTPEVARELTAEDSRVEYHRNTTNRGHIATYNVGIEWCSGDYCILLSADDLLTPGALWRAAELMDEHDEVGMTYGRVIQVKGGVEPSGYEPPPADYGRLVVRGQSFIERACTTGENQVPTPAAILRTAVQKQVGGYRAELPHSGDMEMWLRCAAYADVGVIDAQQAYYRVHGGNMSLDYYRGVGDLRQRCDAFDMVLTGCGARIEGVEELRDAARASVAREALRTAVSAFYRDQLVTCDDALRFAAELQPAIRDHADFVRLRRRRLLGHTACKLLRRVASVFRQNRNPRLVKAAC